MSTNTEITLAIASEPNISPVIPGEFLRTSPFRFDFSKINPDIQHLDMSDANTLQKYIDETFAKNGKTWGLGGYDEERFFYEKSELFRSGNEYRSIHLGLDIWLPAGTPLSSPLPARVHSFQNNAHFLDYGPTIILEHDVTDIVFWTLYGHLSAESLEGLFEGKKIAPGERFATLGAPLINGSWPPHVHWQVIGDLFEKKGDYPGVVTPSERKKYLSVCPDPEILLTSFLKA